MSALMIAYTQYLERMYDESDTLVIVDEETIPFNCNRAVMEEWATAD